MVLNGSGVVLSVSGLVYVVLGGFNVVLSLSRLFLGGSGDSMWFEMVMGSSMLFLIVIMWF